MKMLKVLKSLPIAALFLAAAFFCACSETENPQDAGVWEDEPAIAEIESSDSEVPASSSLYLASSSSVTPESSSSFAEGIHIPENIGCAPEIFITPVLTPEPSLAAKNPAKMAKSAPVVAAIKMAPAATATKKSIADSLRADERFGVLTAFTQKRVEVLEAQGLAHDSAWNCAAEEMLSELGIDSLLANRDIPATYLERALFYLYKDGETRLNPNLVDDFADGKLEQESYCINDEPYDDFFEVAFSFMPIGCVYSDREIEDPSAIVQNIWRKCAGIPYCNKERIGKFNKDSTLMCKGHYDYLGLIELSEGGNPTVYTDWETTSPLDVETAGIPCDSAGKFIVSRKDPSRSYVCRDSVLIGPSWNSEYALNAWDSTTTIEVEMAQVPCETYGTLFKSVLNPGAIYICRDTVWTSPYFWNRDYSLNAWDMATPFEAEVVDVPCDKSGEQLKSTVAPDSFHVCRTGIWGLATRLERETYEIPCDEEGKRVSSAELSGMYYVCSEGEWREFDEVSCENGARYSTVSENDERYKTNYACKDGKWYSNKDETWEIPYELYFNPDIEYGSFTDSRDGRTYRTIEFRGTTWMAENLKYQGTPETFEVDKKFCKNDNCENSGYYYTMEAAEQACPEGWRLPAGNDVSPLSIPEAQKEDGGIAVYLTTRNLLNTLFTQMNSLGVGYDGLDEYGLSFTRTGVFNRDAYVNYDYQYFWFNNKQEGGTVLAEISTYEVNADDRFHDVRQDIKAPVRCVKE